MFSFPSGKMVLLLVKQQEACKKPAAAIPEVTIS